MKKLFNLNLQLVKFVRLMLIIIGLSGAVFGATFTVTKTADTNDNLCDADCSLREAIAAANAAASDDVINFDASVFAAAQTITLTLGELRVGSGGKLNINGTQAALLTISGNNSSRVFSIDTAANATITSVRITAGNGSGTFSSGDGGGVIVDFNGSLTINDSIINNNRAPNGGGGVYSIGILVINNSIINGNFGPSGGGGISSAVGSLYLSNSTVSGNTTTNNAGGGVYKFNSTATIINSVISGNSAGGNGGGIFSVIGTLTLVNSTVSNNTSGNGGGGVSNFSSDSVMTISDSTISSNTTSASRGGGVFNNGPLSVRNTIIGDNTITGSAAAPDFAGSLTSQGYNLIENTNGTNIVGTTTGNITGQDPLLGALQDNGGRTQTRALLAGSPAIDAADPANFPAVDQRGASRPLDGDSNGSALPDIGAFEVGAKIVTKTADTNDGVCDADCSLREAIAEANNSAANDAIIFSSLFNAPQTIILAGGQLSIATNGSLTITGAGTNLLTISGNNTNRIFFINSTMPVTISKLTIANGREDFHIGGGILNSQSPLTLTDIHLRNNSSSSGGAINTGSSAVTINDSVITFNSGRLSGGGISNSGTNTIPGSLTVNNSIIANNLSDDGGGIYSNFSAVTINNSVISNNAGNGGSGGGINNRGVLNINNSTLSNNSATDSGGAIRHGSNSEPLTITNSTVSNNTAAIGGGFRNDSGSTINVFNSTLNGNTASFRGGAIVNDAGTITLTNSTVSGNTATDDGGGILHFGTLTLTNSTISNNSASDQGGGIFNGNGPVNVRNSIIADNSAGGIHPDFSGNLISQGYNLIENTSGLTITGATIGNILGQDPQLAPLRNNGGATQTHALQPTSPAIDAADAANFPPVDQRGVPRPQDGDLNGSALPDIGAYERQVTTFAVTKILDTNDGVCNADCSLREAVAASGGATTIDNAVIFTPSLFNTPRTLTLTNGELQINNPGGTFAVVGAGANLLTISGNNQSRVFFVNSGANATLSGIRVTGGTAMNGGGIYNAGRLTVSNSTVDGSTATNFGGGIFNNDTAILNTFNSVISNNSANIGGGVFSFTNSNLTVNRSTVSGNSATSGYGGGISNNAGTLALNDSTINGNSGNGIYNGGIANLNNSTVSGNSAPNGGGVFSDVILNINNSTVAKNTATTQGGGIYRNTGTINLRSSIVADNAAPIAPDFSGQLNSQGYNLIESISGTIITGTTNGNILGQDAQLALLRNNGGATQTHALSPTSPAVDKGNGTNTDQRGQLRPFDFPNIPNANGGNGADIGAFERQATDVFGSILFDYDGDGKADVSVFRPSNGTWYLQQSTAGFTGVAFGAPDDKIVPADYDGDGRTDVAVFRAGVWYLQGSLLGFTGVSFGAADDIPVPADYDGDGKTDIAVFRPSTGVWYLLRSQLGFVGITFGQAGDKPVAADYDGDGRADVAVFRPSSGSWYLQRSGLGFTGFAFGEATDKPVPADYDGDGKADVAVFRSSNGTWYLQRSSLGFTGIAFGLGTDQPTPADYDGDGKTDVAVFRDGTWYLLRSTQGFASVTFGTIGDRPTPNAFIP